MKRVLIILLLLLSVYTARAELNMRDSLMTVLNSMPCDSTRCATARDLFFQYSSYPFSHEILSFAYDDAKHLDNKYLEITCLYAYMYLYYINDNVGMMQSTLPNLKKLCYKEKQCNIYFSAWDLLLGHYLDKGEYEYVSIEGEKMKEEAKRVDCRAGKITANLTLASLYQKLLQQDKAIATYNEVLNTPNLGFSDHLSALLNIANTYSQAQSYDKSLHYINLSKQFLDSASIHSGRGREINQHNYLLIEFMYADLYQSQKDVINLKAHLDSIQMYLSSNPPVRQRVQYFSQLASYYQLIHNWDGALSALDTIIASTKEHQISDFIGTLERKSDIYWEMGEKRKAIELYDSTITVSDSIYTHLMQKQESAIRNNYLMDRAMLNAESFKVIFRISLIIAICVFLVFMIYFTLRQSLTHIKERKNKRAIEESYKLAEQANRMKESFVKNISYEIRIPLSSVVGFTNVLAASKDLSKEEIANCSAIIKENADKLTILINKVLVLSRIESGMMKFKPESTDILSIFRELNIPFKSDLHEIVREIDRARFFEMIQSMISSESTIYFQATDRGRELVVENSPLAIETDREKEITLTDIQNDINRLLCKQFGRIYEIDIEHKTLRILSQREHAQKRRS